MKLSCQNQNWSIFFRNFKWLYLPVWKR